MTASVVLFVVLGLVLFGAAAVPSLGQHRFSALRLRAVRSGADGRRALEAVALGLRTVAAGRAHGTRPLPEVYAVIHSEQRLTLRLTEADTHPPAPWTARGAGKEWSAAPEDLRRTGADPDARAHPYSLTVTLGHHRGNRVLADLSLLSGAISLTGDPGDVLRLAQNVITELISGPVGLHAEVVLVASAAGPSVTEGLRARSARLHSAATRDGALAHGAARAPEPASASSASRRHSRARTTGGPATTDSHTRRLFVVTAAQFRDENWSDAPLRGTDALLVLGYVPDAGWTFHVNADGSLHTGRLGLQIDTHNSAAP
jgi:hypothetical protein